MPRRFSDGRSPRVGEPPGCTPPANGTGILETLCGVTPVLVFTRYSPGNIGPRNSRGGTRVRGKPEKGEHPRHSAPAVRATTPTAAGKPVRRGI